MSLAEDDADLDCPILFCPYAASGQNAPVLICTARHTISRRAVRQILETQQENASCPFCQRALLHSDQDGFEVNATVVASLQAPVQHANWNAIERLRRSPSNPGAPRPPQCSVSAETTLVRDSQQGFVRELPHSEATWHELAVLGAATLDEDACQCVVQLLSYTDVRDAGVRVTTAVAPPTLQDWMASHADNRLPLDAWLEAAIALAHSLRTLHSRGILHLCVTSGAICLAESPSEPAKLTTFKRARLAPDPIDPPRTVNAPIFPAPSNASTPQEALITPPELGDRAMRQAGSSGVPLTAAADVYAFGVVMLQAWLGYSPFAGLTLDEVCQMQDAGNVEGLLGDMIKEAPFMHSEALAALLQDCVKTDPLCRPSARSLCNQLRTHQLLLLHPDALDSTSELANAAAALDERQPRLPPSTVAAAGASGAGVAGGVRAGGGEVASADDVDLQVSPRQAAAGTQHGGALEPSAPPAVTERLGALPQETVGFLEAQTRGIAPPTPRMTRFSDEQEDELSESVRLAIDAVKALELAERNGEAPPIFARSAAPQSAQNCQQAPPQRPEMHDRTREESCCEACCGPACYFRYQWCCMRCDRCIMSGLCVP